MRNLMTGLGVISVFGAIVGMLAAVFQLLGPVGVIVVPGLLFAYVIGALVNGMFNR